MQGYIYVMSNESFGKLKIGRAKNPEERKKELFSTGVPTPFKLEYSAFVENYEVAEQNVHKALKQTRFRPDREFFTCSVPEAILAIRENTQWLNEDVRYKSPEQIRIEERKREEAKRKKQKEDDLKRLQRERDAKEYQQKRQIELELKQAEWEENKKLFAILIVIVAVIAFFIAVIMAMPFVLFFLAFPAVVLGIIWIIWIIFEKAFQK